MTNKVLQELREVIINILKGWQVLFWGLIAAIVWAVEWYALDYFAEKGLLKELGLCFLGFFLLLIMYFTGKKK